MYECFACVYGCALSVCLVPEEAQKKKLDLLELIWTIVSHCVGMGMEFQSSARAVSVHTTRSANHRVCTPQSVQTTGCAHHRVCKPPGVLTTGCAYHRCAYHRVCVPLNVHTTECVFHWVCKPLSVHTTGYAYHHSSSVGCAFAR